MFSVKIRKLTFFFSLTPYPDSLVPDAYLDCRVFWRSATELSILDDYSLNRAFLDSHDLFRPAKVGQEPVPSVVDSSSFGRPVYLLYLLDGDCDGGSGGPRGFDERDTCVLVTSVFFHGTLGSPHDIGSFLRHDVESYWGRGRMDGKVDAVAHLAVGADRINDLCLTVLVEFRGTAIYRRAFKIINLAE